MIENQKPAAPPPDPGDQRIREVNAQHVKGAMRKIDDPRDAENQRQADRDQKQR